MHLLKLPCYMNYEVCLGNSKTMRSLSLSVFLFAVFCEERAITQQERAKFFLKKLGVDTRKCKKKVEQIISIISTTYSVRGSSLYAQEAMQLHLQPDMHFSQSESLGVPPPQSHRLTQLGLDLPPHKHLAMQRRIGTQVGHTNFI